ncbi:Lrp/AsnC family transcriptional regulator [Virgibacillus sp. W0181]|uniref:Lrp/AsnC family transcriptional regulator n=1 Tax=Virgibacillus sp. W0181 TaxID=3391581 RepID=UPI003F484454
MRLPANKDLDDLDIKILDLLQKESQLSNVELSRRVSLSPPATHARLKRLEKEGYIDQYAVVLSKEKLGFDLLCFIFINTNMHQIEQLEQFEETVLKMPQILECFNLTGEYDYMLKAVLQSREDLHTFIRKLTLLTSISKIQTSIVMKEVKFSTTLPILDEGE